MTGLEKRQQDFHAHLDRCDHCARHPFDLCAIGAALLMATALKAPRTFLEVKTS